MQIRGHGSRRWSSAGLSACCRSILSSWLRTSRKQCPKVRLQRGTFNAISTTWSHTICNIGRKRHWRGILLGLNSFYENYCGARALLYLSIVLLISCSFEQMLALPSDSEVVFSFWNGMPYSTQVHILYLAASCSSVETVAVFRDHKWTAPDLGSHLYLKSLMVW